MTNSLENIGSAFGSRNSLVGLAVVAGGAYLGYKVVKSSLDKALRAKVEAEGSSIPEVAQAQQLRGIINPGFHLSTVLNPANWRYNAAALFALAGSITNWGKVQEYYSRIYGSSASNDVRNTVSAPDYAQFITLLQSRDNTNPNSTDNRALPPADRAAAGTGAAVQKTSNNIVVALKTVRTHPAPSKMGLIDWAFSTDYPAVTFLGYTTGLAQYFAKEDIYFMQIWFYDSKKQVKYAWVTTSKAFVTILAYWADMNRAFPAGVKGLDRGRDAKGILQATHTGLSGFLPARARRFVGQPVQRKPLMQRYPAAEARLQPWRLN